jgi:hypothetical protein
LALKTNARTLGAFAASFKSFENNACHQAIRVKNKAFKVWQQGCVLQSWKK